ncbi:MAG: hypothetical protein ABI426_04015 [Flavobacterium sp.]
MNKERPFLIPIFFLFFIIWIGINSNNEEEDFKNNGKITIGKYVLHKTDDEDGTDLYYFVYYINEKRHREIERGGSNGFSKKINKFYKIKYLEQYEEHILAQFDQQVTDTTQILEAGFSRDEMLNIPSSSHFFPDNK